MRPGRDYLKTLKIFTSFIYIAQALKVEPSYLSGCPSELK